MKKFCLAFAATFFVFLSAPTQARDLPDFTELVDAQGPAVVNISTTQIIKQSAQAQLFPFDENDPAQELFRRFFPGQVPGMPGQQGRPDEPREYKNQSLGSGFIISANGYILTNAHVVDGADEVTVKLTDKREFKAKVLGADKRTDVALIKIEATKLPFTRLGDPEKLKVGEWVVAIGSPFGFENTVTAGIVSAKGRSLTQENFVPFIQTDVPINPGNSGGPLFNMKGEVVGINSQIYSRSGGFMGLSFAIPIDLAMEVQTQLKQNGRVSRGRMGVVIQEVSKDLAESFGLSKAQGALVTSVEKGAAADKAGIVSGDIILKFNGKLVTESSELPRQVGATKPGSKLPVQIWRKGKTLDVMVTMGEIPEDGTPEVKRGRKSSESAKANRLGLVLSALSSEQKRASGLQSGLIVEDVTNEGIRTDLRPGDILLSLIHKGSQVELKSVAQFNELIAAVNKTESITLLVRRGEVQTFVLIKGATDK
ncbi:protease Do [Rugosibacter aromaticivorans]|uniref:Probable periplasmic serine endoprotease DegP-like n=1 Tax=Rugosibacter aromaticivorans TaxID=1565605 RepID=A0A0C5J9D5_9PROT|nr:DegQ family serine endoprotease [Rugosibacter aromaticivorans]AJP48368.1 protease Do [Rugosibacter aromaticivorans]TBR13793.1 MAG: DegQ family serine endoprotease [Rugosibacter sp.]